MGYEIDFLPVGEESKGGDAIALRYGNLRASRAEQTVVVIDGGYTAAGEAMVEHIRTHYQTDRVDIVISSHPDQDHVCGLEVVLERLSVGLLLMHQPWRHSAALQAARKAAFKSAALSEVLAKSLEGASELEQIAIRKGVPIQEPFAGMATNDGCLRIVGPSREYYETLLSSLTASPASAARSSVFEALRKAAAALVPESLHHETLRDDGTTSPQNNSSVITLLSVDGRQSLLTADAGIPALEQAMDRIERAGWRPGSFTFVQVPHHGSRRNVGPSVLNRILGSAVRQNIGTAFVSSPTKNPEHKHPAKKVTNAFLRRGYPVHTTQGLTKTHFHDSPGRASWVASSALPFYNQVEEDSDA